MSPPLTRNHYLVMAERLGVEGRVLIPGYVPEEVLVSLYQSTDLAVYPSLYEGFGLPVIESMACGAPTIAGDNSSLREILPGEARFEPSDPEAIAQAMVRGLTDTAFRARLAEIARQEPPSWDSVADKAATAFEALARRWGDVAARMASPALSGPGRYPARTGRRHAPLRLLRLVLRSRTASGKTARGRPGTVGPGLQHPAQARFLAGWLRRRRGLGTRRRRAGAGRRGGAGPQLARPRRRPGRPGRGARQRRAVISEWEAAGLKVVAFATGPGWEKTAAALARRAWSNLVA